VGCFAELKHREQGERKGFLFKQSYNKFFQKVFKLIKFENFSNLNLKFDPFQTYFETLL